MEQSRKVIVRRDRKYGDEHVLDTAISDAYKRGMEDGIAIERKRDEVALQKLDRLYGEAVKEKQSLRSTIITLNGRVEDLRKQWIEKNREFSTEVSKNEVLERDRGNLAHRVACLERENTLARQALEQIGVKDAEKAINAWGSASFSIKKIEKLENELERLYLLLETNGIEY